MRTCRGRWIVVAAVLLLGSGRAQAGEGLDGAERARAAATADDKQALEAVARSRHGDVWIVVDRLLAQGDSKTAEAVVSAVPQQPDALRAYARNRPARSGHHDPWPILDRIEALRLKNDRNGAQVVLASAQHLPDDGVAAVRADLLRAFLLTDAKAAYAACRQAAARAHALGWRAGHRRALATGVELAYLTRQYEQVLVDAPQLLELLDAARDRQSRYYVYRRLTAAAQALDRHALARDHARTALELARSPTERRDALRHYALLDFANPALHDVRENLLTLRALEQSLGNTHGTAATDAQLAKVETRLGQWSSAVDRIESALAFFEVNGRPFERRGVHQSAALIALEMLDPERVHRHVAAARKSGAGLGLDDTGLLLAEASASAQQRDYEAAERRYRLLLDRGQGVDVGTRVGTWLNVATVQTRDRRPDAAAQSLAAAQAVLSKEEAPPDLRARLLAGQSDHALAVGRFDDAIRYAEQARVAADDLLLHRLASVIETRSAEGYAGKGDWKRALAHANEAVDLILQRSAALPERVGARYRAELRNTFALAVDASLRGGDPAAFFRHAERARAVSLRFRLGGPGTGLELLEPALRARELELRLEETAAVARYRRARQARKPAEAQAALAELQRVRERLDGHRDRMHVRHAAAAQLVDPRVDALAHTQARLAPTEAQIHFARGRSGVVAVVVTRSDVRHVWLGAPDALQRDLDALVLEDPTAPWAPEWARIVARVRTPLALPKTIRALTVVPTVALESLPFAVLWPERNVTLVPSATVGRMLATRAERATGGVLAVGDPAAGEGERLPGAAREAEQIGDQRLQGAEATEAAVRTQLAKRARWRVLHFGCHALVDPVHPMRSALSLAPSERTAGDGLWTVSEILRARVPADLVVLAACSSARGRAFGQEGRIGFVHAFFVAGARQVLVSLWDVDDEAASAFMTRFHAALAGGASAAEAVRSTQAWMRSQPAWRHPAHWAGWQLWGPLKTE